MTLYIVCTIHTLYNVHCIVIYSSKTHRRTMYIVYCRDDWPKVVLIVHLMTFRKQS